MQKQLFADRIREDWGDSLEAEICIKILNHLYQFGIENTYQISFEGFKLLIDRTDANAELLKAIQYLCGDRVNLLTASFNFAVQESWITIPKTDIKEALKTGVFLHPQTGEVIKDFEQKVFLTFEPSENL